MIVYHYDRLGKLNTGDVLSLKSDITIRAETPAFWRELFPSGVSMHGVHYLSDNAYDIPTEVLQSSICPVPTAHTSIYAVYPAFDSTASSICECIFESVRRFAFPTIPSRFQSLFALLSPQALATWPDLFTPSNDAQLFEIEVPNDGLLVLDASFLKGGFSHPSPLSEEKTCYVGFSPLSTWQCAHQYWSGQHSAQPKLECLIPLPVTVGQKIAF